MKSIYQVINFKINRISMAGHDVQYLGDMHRPIWYYLEDIVQWKKDLAALRVYAPIGARKGYNIYKIYLPWGEIAI
jgi:hypothetical protein